MDQTFGSWMAATGNDNGTVGSCVSRIARIEGAYGDLDALFNYDRFAGLLTDLAYSTADSRVGVPNPSRIPIDGDLYTGLASLKSAVNKYRQFREQSDVRPVVAETYVGNDQLPDAGRDTTMLTIEDDEQSLLGQTIGQLEPEPIAVGGNEHNETSRIDPTTASSNMESLLELIVLGELAQEAWFGRRQLIDVGRPVVDAFGYDVTLRCNGVLRHVQFKSRRIDGKAASYKISTRLAECPSGCVVWLGWSPKADTHRVDIAYRWFGGAPGDPLPDLGSTIAKHTKANSAGMKIERPDQRVVPLRRFERIANTSVLLDHLFGAPTR